MMINFFPPSAGGGVYRPLSFVKHLSRWGWKITVVTPEAGEFWITDPELVNEIPSGVRVVRTTSLSGFRLLNMLTGGNRGGQSRRSSGRFGLLRSLGELFLLPDTYVGWVPFARRAGSNICRTGNFDLIYSTSPPDSTHLAAGWLSRKYSLPWVADFRDPWISLYLRNSPTPLHRSIHRRMERSISRADVVLVTTDWHKEVLEERYPHSRVVKIANGYIQEDFAGIDCRPSREEMFHITHCGMLTLGRSSAPILKGLSLLAERHPGLIDRIRVRFIGPRESGNEQWVEHFGLERMVEFVDNLPHSKCVEMEAESHVLLLIKHDDPRYRGLVPGKLFEYIGAGRPILAVVPEGEAGNIVERLNRGEVAGISDPEDIAAKIFKMYSLFSEGELDSRYSLEQVPSFTRRAGAEKLQRVLKSVMEEK